MNDVMTYGMVWTGGLTLMNYLQWYGVDGWIACNAFMYSYWCLV